MFLSDPFREIDSLAQELFRSVPRTRNLPMTAWKTDQSYVIEFEVPGVKREQIDLQVDGRTLTLTVDKPYREGQGEEHANERAWGLARRSIELGAQLDLAEVEAHLEDGVLRLAIPLRVEAAPRSIPIHEAPALSAPTEETSAQA